MTTTSRPDVLFIDNFDSFTFNLVDAFQRMNCAVRVYRNTISAKRAIDLASESGRPHLIVLSPGPGTPEQAGCCLELVARAKGRIPLLGICLGHQAICAEAGAKIERSASIVHGKASEIVHDGKGAFAALENPMLVGRYHSLCVRSVPVRFHIHARLEDMVMAVSDPMALQVGIQFHPESILTPSGDAMLREVLLRGPQAPPEANT